uniref:Uncharacterized protein n=1 Tax=Cyprinus carpio TaxID=7962 RepID=A0A8C2JLK5_CYPCA
NVLNCVPKTNKACQIFVFINCLTTLADSLVASNGIISSRLAGKVSGLLNVN